MSAYLLKPLDEEKVVETIKKIRKAIDDEESRVLEMERLKSYLEESRGSLIEANLNALMESHTHLDSAIRRLDYLGISFQTAFFQVASIKIKPLGETRSKSSPRSKPPARPPGRPSAIRRSWATIRSSPTTPSRCPTENPIFT